MADGSLVWMVGSLETQRLYCEGEEGMIERIDQLPAVITSFAYREEYFPELEAMLTSVRKYHPTWHLVTGKGPVSGFDHPTLEVESSRGNSHWSLPVAFQIDGSENDWLRIVWMKAWWVAQVWHQYGNVGGLHTNRVIWVDADARFNGLLDILLEPEKEVLAGPWAGAAGTPDDHILSGFLIFQGGKGGAVESLIDQWSAKCLSNICNPPAPSPAWQWGEGDQEVLTMVLRSEIEHSQFTLHKLDPEKYCGEANCKTGAPKPGALIDQWMMNEKMRLPKDRSRTWPPPEHARRRAMP